jgi:hypothetical protein
MSRRHDVRSRGNSEKLRQPDEIVCDGSKREDPANLCLVLGVGFCATRRWSSSSRRLPRLTGTLAHGVARVPRCPSVDGRASAGDILRDVRNDALLAQGRNKVRRVVCLVGRQRRVRAMWQIFDHRFGRRTLAPTRRGRHLGLDRSAPDRINCTGLGVEHGGEPLARLRGRALPDARLLDAGTAPRRNTEGGNQPADKSLINRRLSAPPPALCSSYQSKLRRRLVAGPHRCYQKH